MSEDYYNSYLYPLQDDVLQKIGKSATRFYLTGGTFVSRFLLNHRFSDDLDFFLNRDADYRDQVGLLVDSLQGIGKLTWDLRDDAFTRIFIERDNTNLKIEMVNDVEYHVGEVQRHHTGFLLDNWQNVLANKVTALQREAAKDFVDILFIALKFKFNWEEILNHAKQKDAWIAEHNAADILVKFDLKTLKSVTFPSSFDQSCIKQVFVETIARDLFNGFNNSLFSKTL